MKSKLRLSKVSGFRFRAYFGFRGRVCGWVWSSDLKPDLHFVVMSKAKGVPNPTDPKRRIPKRLVV